MNPARALGLLVLLGLFAAAAWLAYGSFGSGPMAPPPTDAGSPEQAVPAPALAAGAAEATAPGTRQEDRVAVEAASPLGDGVACFVGTVVDDAGKPVADAAVTCLPFLAAMATGFAEFDFSDFEAEDFGDLSPAALASRWRELDKQKTSARTGTDGSFRVAAAGTGPKVALQVHASGHVAVRRTLPRPKATTDVGTVVAARGAIAEGRVLDPTGTPIAGARVRASRKRDGNAGWDPDSFDIDFPGGADFESLQGREVAASDADGRFRLVHVEPGEFTLRARHPDHPAARLDGLTAVPGRTLPDLLLTMERGATIRGRALGLPAAGAGFRVLAQVRPAEGRAPGAGDLGGLLGGDALELAGDFGFPIGERAADLGADGAFELRGLQQNRTYRIWLSQSDDARFSPTGGQVCSQRLDAAAGSAGIELRYDTGITLTCQVVDARTATPITDVWVRAQLRGSGRLDDMLGGFQRGPQQRQKDPQGRVLVADLRPKKKQTLTLTISATGFATFEKKGIALPALGNLDLGTVSLEPHPVVHVTVAGADGQAVTDARVQLRAAGESRANPFEQLAAVAGGSSDGVRTAKTDAEGRCTLNALCGTDAQLAIEHKEFAPYASEPFRHPDQGDLERRATLVRGGSVRVVAIEKEQPAAGERIDHRSPAGTTSTRKTDADGVASFERLAPGTHRFRLAGRGGADALIVEAMGRGGADRDARLQWSTIEVTDGSTLDLRLEKQPTAAVRGIVRENGVPLAGARVAFVEGKGTGDDNTEEMAANMLAEIGGASGSREAKAGADGAFSLAELPEGEHRLRVTHKSRVMSAVIPVALRLGDNQVDVELDCSTIRGIVRDPAGNPLTGASVSVRAAPRSSGGPGIADAMADMMPGMNLPGFQPKGTKSGADGTYELRGVEPGTMLTVRATMKGMAAVASAPFSVARGGTVEGVDVQLGAAGKIKVTVANAPAIVAVRATFDGEGDVTPAVTMLRQGSGTLDGLRPGKWKVALMQRGDEQGQEKVVEVVAGQTAQVGF